MANTTNIRGSVYGIGIIDSVVDLEKIVDALNAAGIEVDHDSTATQIVVSTDDLYQAVEIINSLGYSTDEDEDGE